MCTIFFLIFFLNLLTTRACVQFHSYYYQCVPCVVCTLSESFHCNNCDFTYYYFSYIQCISIAGELFLLLIVCYSNQPHTSNFLALSQTKIYSFTRTFITPFNLSVRRPAIDFLLCVCVIQFINKLF